MFQPEYYIGIDCDEKRIAYARNLYKNYNFFASQGAKLFIEDNSIDYVLIMAVLHHIPSQTIGEHLLEFHRVLKPTGRIIIIEPCFFPGSHLRNWCMSFFDKGEFIRSEQDYLRLFHQYNYKTAMIKRFSKCSVYNELFFTANPER
ncbi:ubiquinone/menaquinone biosynthesis C-methylase UbiE [Anaerosolibacter carboniphilus]|uniref:Ubiquinone/menaquinone biosynthesis C-methylase UbiE n=2 Tax=Anaerosolibacter carboniphilus TaxID=1417629 RepID=A0A841KNE1_9FIRM|nr:ubiquinone/menaquinone biosynthesis C-methylase UbiE [Anaerosolibacter carboniphilus]